MGAEPMGPTEVAIVLSITDGDTIRVDRGNGSEPVRYIGIDTPDAGEPGVDAAKAANAALVEGREVVLESDVSDLDQFDRLLRYVWLHEGTGWILVNRELIKGGFAEALEYPPDVLYADIFARAQAGARSRLLGIWAPPPPTPIVTAPPAPTAPPPDPTQPPSANCHPSYDPCLPIVDDLDCPDVRAMGLAPVHVIGPDSYRLDGDNDGLGCE